MRRHPFPSPRRFDLSLQEFMTSMLDGPTDYTTARKNATEALAWPLSTAYERWQDEQGIPIHRGFYIEDLADVELGHWSRLDAQAAFVNLDGAEETTGAYVLKIAAAHSTNPEKQLFEQIHYVVSGAGRTELEGSREIPWRAGTVFSVPANCPIRHHASDEAVMYVVNSAPLVINLFHHHGFVFENPYVFDDRTPTENDVQKQGLYGRLATGFHAWDAMAFDDCPSVDLPMAEARGKDNRTLLLQFGENTLTAHLSEFPVGSYKKAHRHGPGSQVLLLNGRGYSLLWKDDLKENVRVEWQPNSIFIPPSFWWHQHFNTGAEPARYLALRWGSKKHRLDHAHDKVTVNQKDDGDQIEYDDQDPWIHQTFIDECKRHGVRGAHSETA